MHLRRLPHRFVYSVTVSVYACGAGRITSSSRDALCIAHAPRAPFLVADKKWGKEAAKGKQKFPLWNPHPERGSRPMKCGSNHGTADHCTQVLCGEPTWLSEVHRRWSSLEWVSKGKTGVFPSCTFAYFPYKRKVGAEVAGMRPQGVCLEHNDILKAPKVHSHIQRVLRDSSFTNLLFRSILSLPLILSL